MAIPEGTKLGRYEIRSILGAGGMGEVYLADDLSLHRKVAIKVLRADVISDEERRRRFEIEALAASSLNHPNILTIHEIGHEGEYHFMVTEFIDGVSLGQRLKTPPMRMHEILEVGIQVASALAAAHAAGITHRDIKPDNIMLRRDSFVKVLDFGLAKLSEPERALDKEVPLTTPGMVMGTARYMSPEQARGLAVDARTDIWSLGVVLYELVGTHLPFTGRTMSDVIAAVLTTHPPLLSTYRPDVPAELERIVTKALRKDEEERYQLVKDLGLDLKALKQRLEFEAELERSGEGRRSGEVKRTGPEHPQTAETLVASKLKSPLRAESSAESVSEREAGLTRVKRDTDSQRVATVSAGFTAPAARSISKTGRLTSLARRRWKALAAVAIFGVVALAGIGVYWRLHKPSVNLTEKDTIVLADFTNTTGDAAFDDTLRTALAFQLRQSPFMNVLSDDRVGATLKLMNRRTDERLTQEVAREICLRTNGTALLAGSIASVGDHFMIALKALNCGAGNVLARTEVEAENRSQVVKALGEAGNQMRQKLGESLPSLQKYNVPLDEVTTTSLEALQEYTQGYQVANNSANYSKAIEFFQRAVTLDPNFATAYAKLSANYSNMGNWEKAAESSRKAYELRYRVSERERFYIASQYETKVTGNLEAARKIFLEWEQTYPRDDYLPNNLALVYHMLGDFEKLLEENRKSLKLDPGSAISYQNLVASYLYLNRLDEAKATAQEAQARGVDTMEIHGSLYAVAFLQKDSAEMERHTNWMVTKGGWEDAPQVHSIVVAHYGGQFSRARELGQQLLQRIKVASRPASPADADSAVSDALVGNLASAKRQAEAAVTLPYDKWFHSTGALALALAGESARATKMADDFANRYPEDTLIQFVRVPLIRAAIALQSGDPGKALEALGGTAPYELSNLRVVYFRGQANLATGNGSAAAVEFQKIIDHPGLFRFDILVPLAHLGLGRAYARAGDTVKATTAYQDFFALWKDADPDIPILKEARAEYEKLK